ncbi:hypothetical protein J2W56_001172 [Nocardia kruczakiae]|uniref:Uncharacterized protein n=1 Tax=Nocardia kruczakiae TaxID=261477 RepID=A0ABU1XAG5_9NOCA|nr:hypothetical protein [Nocardia kruczakiae]
MGEVVCLVRSRVSRLWTIRIIAGVANAALALCGALGRPVAGRTHYYCPHDTVASPRCGRLAPMKEIESDN